MTTGDGLPFDTRIVTRAALNVGTRRQVQRLSFAVANDSSSGAFSSSTGQRRKPSNNVLEHYFSGIMKATGKALEDFKGGLGDATSFLDAVLAVAALLLVIDFFQLGNQVAVRDGAPLANGFFSSLASNSWLYASSTLSYSMQLFSLSPIIGSGILLIVFLAVPYLMYRHADYNVSSFRKFVGCSLVALFLLFGSVRLLAALDELKSSSAPETYIALTECNAGYQILSTDRPRYLRIDGEGTTIFGDGRLSAPTNPGSPPLIFSDAGDYGLVKRSDGIKPVAPAKSSGETIIEPAYVSVRLCVKDETSLPASLGAIGVGGGR